MNHSKGSHTVHDKNHMRIEGDLFFNPRFRWSEVKLNEIDTLIEEYEVRIDGYYLHPVQQLLSNQESIHCNGFASGVLLLSAIDAIGTFQTKKNGFKNKFIEFIKNDTEYIQLEEATKNRIAGIMTNEFRNGLLHNGRIKNGCEFSFDSPYLFYIANNTLVVNPNEFYRCVKRNKSTFFEEMKKSENKKRLFKVEFERLYKRELNDFG